MAKVHKTQPVKKAIRNSPTKEAVKKPILNWDTIHPKKIAAFLFLIALLQYANTYQNSYVLDDLMIVPGNTIVQKGISAIPEIFSTPYLSGYIHLPNDNYRPLSIATFAMETKIFGVNPNVNHAFNVFYFACCAIALFFLLYHLFGAEKIRIAFFATLLFIVHPIHTEVVANIKSRDELLCFLFGFLALTAFIKYSKTGKFQWLIAACASFLLSLFSKETSITFLAVIPLLFILQHFEHQKRSYIIIAASLVPALIFLFIRYFVLHTCHADNTSFLFFIDNVLVKTTDMAARFATPLSILGGYLKMMFIPYPLICSYAYKSIPITGFGDLNALLSIAVYLCLTVYAIVRIIKNKKDIYSFGFLFWLFTISITSNIFFLIASLKAERFLFFPSVGFSVIIAQLADDLKSGKMKFLNNFALLSKNVFWIFLAVCCLYGSLTYNRNLDWKDNYTLFSVDLPKNPENARLNFYLGNEMSTNYANSATDALTRQRIIEESIPYMEKAVSIYPQFDVAHTSLGTAFFNLQKFDSAEIHHKAALSIDTLNVLALNGLAGIYFMKKDYPKARDILQRDISINPNNSSVLFNLGNSYLNMQKFDSAIIYYRKAIQQNPKQPESLKGMCIAYHYLGKEDSVGYYLNLVRPFDPAFKL